MKIVKFFVVFNLILSISLINSVAAISVSDGSAFVTKAEFAADLNNLSNRMSTLENSLDAKIDSLVSSYLSRNGIWNGEKQELINNSFPKKNQLSSDNIIVNQYGSLINSDVLFEPTKSGLAFLYGSTLYTDFTPPNTLGVSYTGPGVFEVFIGNQSLSTIKLCREKNFVNYRAEAEDTRTSTSMTATKPIFYTLGNNSIFMNFFVTKGEKQYFLLFFRSSVNNVGMIFKDHFVKVSDVYIY